MFMWPVGGKSPLFPRTFDGLDICFQVGWPATVVCNIYKMVAWKKCINPTLVAQKELGAPGTFLEVTPLKMAEKKLEILTPDAQCMAYLPTFTINLAKCR